jgi:hypothetical protein
MSTDFKFVVRILEDNLYKVERYTAGTPAR